MITIQGLSPKQMLYADILWQLSGREQVNAFIRSLPKAEQAEAVTVMNMMVAAIFDNIGDTGIANEVLTRYR